MRCDTCLVMLDEDDNYCRKCGTPVQVVQMPAVHQAQPPALFRSTAGPLATGAAAVAATAVLRWAVRQAVRGLLAGEPARAGRRAGLDRDLIPRRRALAGRDAQPSTPATTAARAPKQVVEILWYRRTMRD